MTVINPWLHNLIVGACIIAVLVVTKNPLVIAALYFMQSQAVIPNDDETPNTHAIGFDTNRTDESEYIEDRRRRR
jgi:hypothetical protein